VALVVDHDRATRELISQLLTERGYETAVAATYAQALAIFEARGPRLVVIDPVLSDGEGIELVRRAKSSARVLITSAFPTRLVDAAASLGVPLVVKPFEIDHLLAQID
jgi:DNA-binding response OmpR family regulator